MQVHSFTATLKILGVNPYVSLPEQVLASVLVAAGAHHGKIPVQGTVNGKHYTQTLVRYAGEWRLYVNMKMLNDSPRRIGERLDLEIALDPRDRSLPLHPEFERALLSDEEAARAFAALPPSRRHELNRYICKLKSDERRSVNVLRAIAHLKGDGSFVGRRGPNDRHEQAEARRTPR